MRINLWDFFLQNSEGNFQHPNPWEGLYWRTTHWKRNVRNLFDLLSKSCFRSGREWKHWKVKSYVIREARVCNYCPGELSSWASILTNSAGWKSSLNVWRRVTCATCVSNWNTGHPLRMMWYSSTVAMRLPTTLACAWKQMDSVCAQSIASYACDQCDTGLLWAWATSRIDMGKFRSRCWWCPDFQLCLGASNWASL